MDKMFSERHWKMMCRQMYLPYKDPFPGLIEDIFLAIELEEGLDAAIGALATAVYARQDRMPELMLAEGFTEDQAQHWSDPTVTAADIATAVTRYVGQLQQQFAAGGDVEFHDVGGLDMANYDGGLDDIPADMTHLFQRMVDAMRVPDEADALKWAKALANGWTQSTAPMPNTNDLVGWLMDQARAAAQQEADDGTDSDHGDAPDPGPGGGGAPGGDDDDQNDDGNDNAPGAAAGGDDDDNRAPDGNDGPPPPPLKTPRENSQFRPAWDALIAAVKMGSEDKIREAAKELARQMLAQGQPRNVNDLIADARQVVDAELNSDDDAELTEGGDELPPQAAAAQAQDQREEERPASVAMPDIPPALRGAWDDLINAFYEEVQDADMFARARQLSEMLEQTGQVIDPEALLRLAKDRARRPLEKPDPKRKKKTKKKKAADAPAKAPRKDDEEDGAAGAAAAADSGPEGLPLPPEEDMPQPTGPRDSYAPQPGVADDASSSGDEDEEDPRRDSDVINAADFDRTAAAARLRLQNNELIALIRARLPDELSEAELLAIIEKMLETCRELGANNVSAEDIAEAAYEEASRQYGTQLVEEARARGDERAALDAVHEYLGPAMATFDVEDVINLRPEEEDDPFPTSGARNTMDMAPDEVEGSNLLVHEDDMPDVSEARQPAPAPAPIVSSQEREDAIRALEIMYGALQDDAAGDAELSDVQRARFAEMVSYHAGRLGEPRTPEEVLQMAQADVEEETADDPFNDELQGQPDPEEMLANAQGMGPTRAEARAQEEAARARNALLAQSLEDAEDTDAFNAAALRAISEIAAANPELFEARRGMSVFDEARPDSEFSTNSEDSEDGEDNEEIRRGMSVYDEARPDSEFNMDGRFSGNSEVSETPFPIHEANTDPAPVTQEDGDDEEEENKPNPDPIELAPEAPPRVVPPQPGDDESGYDGDVEDNEDEDEDVSSLIALFEAQGNSRSDSERMSRFSLKYLFQ